MVFVGTLFFFLFLIVEIVLRNQTYVSFHLRCNLYGKPLGRGEEFIRAATHHYIARLSTHCRQMHPWLISLNRRVQLIKASYCHCDASIDGKGFRFIMF